MSGYDPRSIGDGKMHGALELPRQFYEFPSCKHDDNSHASCAAYWVSSYKGVVYLNVCTCECHAYEPPLPALPPHQPSKEWVRIIARRPNGTYRVEDYLRKHTGYSYGVRYCDNLTEAIKECQNSAYMIPYEFDYTVIAHARRMGESMRAWIICPKCDHTWDKHMTEAAPYPYDLTQMLFFCEGTDECMCDAHRDEEVYDDTGRIRRR